MTRIATIQLYENDYIEVPWEKTDDSIVLSHEITEKEASKLLPSCCGIFSSRGLNRCNENGCPWWREHHIRVSNEYGWPPAHMFASIAFGCGIEVKDGWLTLSADQCWCLLKHTVKPQGMKSEEGLEGRE